MTTTRPELSTLKRGDVVLGVLGKSRTMVVVSAEMINASGEVVIVVPITGFKGKRRDHEVFIPKDEGGLTKDSLAQPHLIMWLDEPSRPDRVLGRLSEPLMKQITSQLMLILGHLTSSSGQAR